MSVSGMRGYHAKQHSFVSLIDVEKLIAADHSIRAIKRMCDEALGAMSAHFDEIYASYGAPSIPPETLLYNIASAVHMSHHVAGWRGISFQCQHAARRCFYVYVCTRAIQPVGVARGTGARHTLQLAQCDGSSVGGHFHTLLSRR
jgi:hypothetical protein